MDHRDHGRIQPMPCENVLRLRMGQSRAEVRALIGTPQFEFEGHSGWAEGDSSYHERSDYTFYYAPGRGQGAVVGYRDSMRVAFLSDRLVTVSAYRMFEYVFDKEEIGRGLGIGPQTRGSAAVYEVTDDFDSMFPCTSTPGLEAAKRHVLAAGSASAPPANSQPR